MRSTPGWDKVISARQYADVVDHSVLKELPICQTPHPPLPPARPPARTATPNGAATILLLGVTVLVQALTGHTVAVQVIVGLALVAALLTFLRVTDVERFVMNRSGVTLDLVRVQVALAPIA